MPKFKIETYQLRRWEWGVRVYALSPGGSPTEIYYNTAFTEAGALKKGRRVVERERRKDTTRKEHVV